jgi:hypothetical protein
LVVAGLFGTGAQALFGRLGLEVTTRNMTKMYAAIVKIELEVAAIDG